MKLCYSTINWHTHEPGPTIWMIERPVLIRPDKISVKDTKHEQRMQMTSFKSPDEIEYGTLMTQMIMINLDKSYIIITNNVISIPFFFNIMLFIQ